MANSGQTEAPPSAKQLVFVAMMATVVAVIVFLCGVLVGRGLPAQRMGAGDPVRSSVTDAALFDGDVAAPDGSSPLEGLSYHDELTEPVPAPAPRASAPSETETAELQDVLGDAEVQSAPPPVPETLPDPPAPPPPAPEETGYMVQVTALRDPGEARAVADRLIGAGYPAVVVAPADGESVGVFRVQVGPFEDSTEADRIKERLETEEAFTPWVIQP